MARLLGGICSAIWVCCTRRMRERLCSVPTLRRLAVLREAANRPNKPQGETRVSPAPGGRIFSARGHLLAQA